jgi:hypothetical protein
VDVQVEHRLACGFADVDADVEAVGAVVCGDQVSASVEVGCEGRSFLSRGVEPGRDVPSRDEEQVAFADREGVPEGPREVAFEGDAVLGGGAERALGGGRHRAVVGIFVPPHSGSILAGPALPARRLLRARAFRFERTDSDLGCPAAGRHFGPRGWVRTMGMSGLVRSAVVAESADGVARRTGSSLW